MDAGKLGISDIDADAADQLTGFSTALFNILSGVYKCFTKRAFYSIEIVFNGRGFQINHSRKQR